MATLAVINWGSSSTATYLQTVVYVLTLAVLIAQLRKLSAQTKMQRDTIIRDATEEIFREWWSDDFRQLREYFFLKFMPEHLPKLSGRSLKELDMLIPEDLVEQPDSAIFSTASGGWGGGTD